MRNGEAGHGAGVPAALCMLLVVIALGACALTCSSASPAAAATQASAAMPARTASAPSTVPLTVTTKATSAANPTAGRRLGPLAEFSTAITMSGMRSCCGASGDCHAAVALNNAPRLPMHPSPTHSNASPPEGRPAPAAADGGPEPVPIALAELNLLRI